MVAGSAERVPLTVEMKGGLVNVYNADGNVVHWNGYRSFQERAVASYNALFGIANVEPLPNLLAYLDRFLLHLDETGEYDNDLLSAIVVTLMQMGRDPNTAVNAPQVDPTGGFTATGGRVGPDGLPSQAEKLYDVVRGQTDRCTISHGFTSPHIAL